MEESLPIRLFNLLSHQNCDYQNLYLYICNQVKSGRCLYNHQQTCGFSSLFRRTQQKSDIRDENHFRVYEKHRNVTRKDFFWSTFFITGNKCNVFLKLMEGTKGDGLKWQGHQKCFTVAALHSQRTIKNQRSFTKEQKYPI